MSTTIDERVVEMRFDNKHFESNVKTSMSTLDKLKQSLNLTGASKGLENVSSAAKKVDMSGLGRGIEAVSLKFSALQVVGVTALANLTNSAVNAGKRMTKALTIEPITTGFQEYETQINATQTILANTQSKGSDINDVNKALEELNAYADKTIYNFTEMTRNIGTFTAAGIDLDTSVNAIQGIANLAAVSGSNAQQASTAMYQLSQALAAGKVQLMDWNSVVNAGMGGQMFQDALRETSELLGTGAEQAIKLKGSFRESLREGWLTSEVLTETLKKFTTTGANEYIAEYTGLTKEAVDAETKAISSAKDQKAAIDAAAEALAKKSGKNKEEIKQALEFAQNAEDAATKVKTFSQLWDVMKESAQSGWSQTWKLLVGDFEEAKNLLTPLADFLTGAINKFSEARNKLLEGALNNPFANLIKEVSTMTSGIGDAVDTVKNYSEVVDKIINGDFGTGQARWDKLTEAGYDWAHAQNLVNEKLGDGTRHATEYKEAQEGVANAQSKSLDELAAYSDAQLRIMGYSDKQIKALRELQSEADKLGMSMEDFVENVDELDGRTLLIKSFKNIGEALVNVFGQLKYAWKTIFPPMSSEQLYNIIAGFHKLTTYLEMDEFTAIKLKDTFMGLFAAIDIIATLVGGGFRIAFNLVTEILKYFDMDILDVTSGIGKLIIKFRAWLDSTLDIQAALDIIVPAITKGIDAVKGWVKAFKNLPEVQKYISNIKEAFEALKEVDLAEFGRYLIDGLVKGISGGAGDVITGIVQMAKDLVAKFCEFLGIHSPSTVFIAIGGFIIAGLLKGISEGFIKVPESLKKIADQCVSVFENIDWGAIAAIGISVGGLLILKKLTDILENITSPLASLGDLFTELSGGVKRISKAVANDINTKAIKNLAIGIGILAVALIAITYTYNKYGNQMWGAVLMIGSLAVILGLLAFAVGKMSDASVSIGKDGASINGIKTSLLAIAAAIGILGLTVKLLGSMDTDSYTQGMFGLVGLMGAITLFAFACQKIVQGSNPKQFEQLGSLLLKISIAMLLMVGVCKSVGKLSPTEMLKGAIFAAAFALFVKSLANSAKLGKKQQIGQLGGLLISISFAMILMVGVCKLVDRLSPSEMLKGGIFALAFIGFVKLLTKATTISSDSAIGKLAGLLISISFSMALMVGVCKLVGNLSVDEMKKGGLFVLAFTVFVAALVKITTISSDKQTAKLAGTILAIAVAIGILAGVCMLLSLLKTEGLVKGILAVGALSIMMAMMIKSLKGANDVMKSLIVMTAAIAIMAIAVAGLSLIEPDRLAGATAAMTLLMGTFALILRSGKKINGSLPVLIVMTAAIAALAFILYRLSTIDPKASIPNAVALSTLLIAMSGALLILSKIKVSVGGALKGAIGLTLMAIPMLAFVEILKRLDGVNIATENVKILVGLMVAMTLLLAVLTVIGLGLGFAVSGIVALTAMWIPMFAMIDIIKRVSGIDIAIANVTILTALMSAMTALLAKLTVIGVGAIFAVSGIVALTAMWIPMFAMIDIIKRVSGIDIATNNVNLLINLMKTMTDILTQLAIIGPMALVGVAAMSGLTLLMGAIGTMATGIGALQDSGLVDIQSFLDTGLPLLEQLAGSIGTMIGNFVSGALTSISGNLPQIGSDLSKFMDNLGIFIAGAKTVNESVTSGVKTLALAILTLTGAELLTGIANFMSGGNVSLPKLGYELTAFMFNALGFIAGAKMVDESLITAAGTMAEVILILTAADLISGVSSFLAGGINFEDMGNTFSQFAKAVCDFSTAIQENGGVNRFAIQAAKDAADIFLALQDSLPKTGGLWQSIAGEADLAEFGQKCVAFATSMCLISATMKANGGIDIDAIGKLKEAGVAMNELQTALPKTGGLWQSVAGEQDLTTFGLKCQAFANSMILISQTFKETGTDVDVSNIKKLKTAGEAMNELQTTLPKTGGWWQSVAGTEDLSLFGQKCQAFANSMILISRTFTEDGNNIDVENIKKLKTAGEALNELQSTLPTSGGWWQSVAGEQDIGDFGAKIKKFGEALGEFSTAATNIDTSAIQQCISASYSVKRLMTSLVDIDFSGVEKFTGIGTGGVGADGPLHDVGVAMKDFSEEVAGLDVTAVNTSVTAANKLKNLINNLVNVDTSGIENFQVKKIGTAMKDYNGQVKNIDTAVVSSSVSSANKLKNLINSLVGIDTSGISRFNVKSIGDKMKAYSGAVSDINAGAINASVSSANKLKNLINSLAGIDASGVGSFKKAIEELSSIEVGNIASKFNGAVSQLSNVGGKLIDGIANGMKSKRMSLTTATTSIITALVNNVRKSATMFKTAGTTLMTQFVSGIKSKQSATASAVKTNITSSISGIRGYYLSFYNAGSYLVSGFATGISANAYKAAAKARAMAKAAKEAAEEALGIASPSKVFYKIGDYTGQGFVNALSDYGTKSYNAGSEMADHATSGLNDSIGKIRDLINGDLDTNPTIRPVLDLSDLKSGVSSINGMFGTGASVGLMTNVGAISASMNQRNQNGFSSEVVDAIDKLGKKLDNVGGNYYNVDGITYDDGSNVSAAVEDLTRAIRLERRS